jgi:hypothetical protein
MASTWQGGVDDVGHELVDSSDNVVSVVMANWNIEHHVFTIEQFFRNRIYSSAARNVGACNAGF